MTATTTDSIEFCPSCAREARVRIPGRWSVGIDYKCPTCPMRFTWHYQADPDDPRVLGSVLVEMSA